ncbi:Leucine-rich repeat protein kinase family protein, partial [Prunus dulcis]
RAIVSDPTSDLDQTCRTRVLYLVEPIGTFRSEFGGRGPRYPACRQTPYVALVVPAYGGDCDMMFRSRVA